MQLTWIPSTRRFVGTQTEARQARLDFETVEVPIVKADLIAYLNGVEERHEAELAALRAETSGRLAIDVAAEDDDPTAPPASTRPAGPATPMDPTATPDTPGIDAIEDAIMDMAPQPLGRVLSVAVGRLGEVAGTHGWAAFGKTTYGWTPGARNVEQGLGMLMLAAMETLHPRTKEADRPIQPTPQGEE